MYVFYSASGTIACSAYRSGHYDSDIAPAFITCDSGSGIVRCPDHLGRNDNTSTLVEGHTWSSTYLKIGYYPNLQESMGLS